MDWSSCIKPLLAGSANNFTPADLAKLSKTISACRDELLNHPEEFSAFYSRFVALSTHFLCANYNMVNAGKVDALTVQSACNVLIEYLGTKLLTPQFNGEYVTHGQVVLVVKSLTGASGCLFRPDVISLITKLKSSNFPPHIRNSIREKIEEDASSSPEKTTETKRGGALASIFDSITAPLSDFDSDSKKSKKDIKDHLMNENIKSLMKFDLGSKLVDVCLCLPHIGRCIEQKLALILKKNGKPADKVFEDTGISLNEINNELDVVGAILELPLIIHSKANPNKMCDIAMGSLILATESVLSRMKCPAEDTLESENSSLDSCAYNILQSAMVSVLIPIKNAINALGPAGLTIIDNMRALTCICLMSSIAVLLEKYGAKLVVSEFVEQFLMNVAPLLKDAKADPCMKDGKIDELTLNSCCTSAQRLMYVDSKICTVNVLLKIAATMFSAGVDVGDSGDHSDSSPEPPDSDLPPPLLVDVSARESSPNLSNTDLVSVTPDTSADSTDETSLLGNWLEELFASVPQLADSGKQPVAKSLSRRKSTMEGFTGPLREAMPSNFKWLTQAIECIRTLNSALLNGPSLASAMHSHMREAFCNKETLMIMANIIKQLDTIHRHSDANVKEMALEMSKLMHNLLVNEVLDEKAQDCLIGYLIECNLTDTNPWPLHISRRGLAVIGQILLLNINKKQDDKSRGVVEKCVLNVWSRFMKAVSEAIQKSFNAKEEQMDNIVNVEHVQLMLVLFHSLSLLSKKALFLQLAETLTNISNAVVKTRDCEIGADGYMNVSCMLLVFEYMMRQFYEPAPSLIEHVQENIFTLDSLMAGTERANLAACHVFVEMDDIARSLPKRYRSLSFYNLFPQVWSESEMPKLDGLAINFLLASAHYDSLYSSLVALYSSEAVASPFKRKEGENPNQMLCCCLSYMRLTLWRVLGQLPFSAQYLKQLLENSGKLPTHDAFNMLRFGSRLKNLEYKQWIMDMLQKQEMNETDAETLIKSCAELFVYPIASIQTIIWQQKDFSYPGLLHLHLCLLRLRWLLASKSKLNEDSSLTAEEMGALQAVITILDPLKNAAIEAVQEEATRDGGDQDVPPMELTSMLLALGQPGCISTLMEAKALYSSFTSWAPHRLMRAVELWRSCEKQHPQDKVVDVFTPEFGEKSCAEEMFLAEVHWKHMLGLADKYSNATLTVAHRCWGTALRLVVDVLHSNKQTDWPQIDMDAVFLPHLFCILANNNISEKLHSVLNLTKSGKKEQRVRFEKENGYFIEKCFYFLLNHNKFMYETPITAVSYVVSKLTECVKRHQTWPAWAKYLKEEDVAGKLCAQNDAGKCPALLIMAWIELLLAIIEKSEEMTGREKQDPRLQDMQMIERKLLIPMLQYKPLVVKWANNFAEVALDALLAEIRVKQLDLDDCSDSSREEQRYMIEELNVASLRPDRFVVFVKAVNRYVTHNEQSDWAVTAAHVFLDCIITILNSVIIKPVSPLFNDSDCLLRLSDRWLDSTLETVGAKQYAMDSCFNQLITLAISLADVAGGTGHTALVDAAQSWLKTCESHLSIQKNVEAVEGSVGPLSRQDAATLALCVDSCTSTLAYIRCLMKALVPNAFVQDQWMDNTSYADSSMHEQSTHFDEQQVGEDEESGGDDSGDEQLDTRLCTFVVTAKEFMNQHWYHCHTCGLTEGEGVCSVCAKVCHKDHDMSYSKFGSFFCDCGAKANGCLALTKRNDRVRLASSTDQNIPSGFDGNRHPVLTKIASLPNSNTSPRIASMLQVLEFRRSFVITQSFCDKARTQLLTQLQKSELENRLGSLLKLLNAPILQGSELRSTSGALERRRKALEHCANGPHTIDSTLLLMEHSFYLPENSIENVKLSLAGEPAQTLRQLIQSHSVDRKAMVATTVADSKRQFLVVAVDKCKLFVFDAQVILKQMASIPRCGFETLSFTVVSLSAMDDCVAACGLKECQLVCLSPHGSIVDRLNINLKLEGHNYIIKAVWCPDTRGLLAVITADFTNVYDLTTDCKEPLFQFEPPVGKIRDAVFACWEVPNSTGTRVITRHLLMMSSLGYVYLQGLNQDCLYSQHGAFFVTSMLQIENQEMTESTICGGGVSIYYSHTLQQIFVSYANGTTQFGHLDNANATAIKDMTVIFKKTQTDGKEQPLVGWTEIGAHPGVIMASKQMAGNPLIFYFGPSRFHMQEMGNLSKAKVVDSALLVSGQLNSLSHRLHTVVLCEDGAMQLLVEAASQALDYWLDSPSHTLFPPLTNPLDKNNSASKKRKQRSGTGTINFPVDFFESCQNIQDVEFGGKDMLHIYNSQQLKNRLNTQSLYVLSMKAGGFTLEVTCKESALLACGVRVELGRFNMEAAPNSISVFGRTREVHLVKPRWIDVPFTKEEALLANNKFSIQFGPSNDSGGHIYVDSVKVYGRNRDSTGWVDDIDILKQSSKDDRRGTDDSSGLEQSSCILRQPYPPEVLHMTLLDSIATLYIAFNKFSFDASRYVDEIVVSNVHLSTILTAKAVMRKNYDNETEYYEHKDDVFIKTAVSMLHNAVSKQDAALFSFALMLLRNVAVSRPENFIKRFSEGIKGSKYTSLAGFLTELMDIFWKIHRLLPEFPKIQPASDPGVLDIGACVRSIVEIVHCYCYSSPSANSTQAAEIYSKLLLSKDVEISQACKLTLNMIYRLKHKSSKTPSSGGEMCRDNQTGHQKKGPARRASLQISSENEELVIEPELHDALSEAEAEAAAMEAELEAAGDQLQVFETFSDGDGLDDLVSDDHPIDEEAAMVELAIALSLQQDDTDDQSAPADTAEEDTEQLSDTSASGFSDEEGSNAATDGSTLRMSPVEDRIPEPTLSNAASESGASANESASGPSSVYGGESSNVARPDDANNAANSAAAAASTSAGQDEREKMHEMQLNLLEHLIGVIPELTQVHEGMRCVAFMQTVLMLTNDLDTNNDRDIILVHRLVDAVLLDLQLNDVDGETQVIRTRAGELQLLKLRLLSVLLQKIKTRTKTIPASCMYIASHTAKSIMQAGAMTFCKNTLQALLPFWKGMQEDKNDENRVLPLRSKWWCIDLSPFFLSQFVQEHGRDIFESYIQLITEMALRLPYQMRKVQDVNPDLPKLPFDQEWEKLLCELVSCQEAAFVRRQARKLLLLIAGSKDNYRLVRDQYSVMGHLNAIKHLCALSPGQTSDIDSINRPLNLTYSNLNVLMDHLRCIAELASSRVGNWQKLCAKSDASQSQPSILIMLMRLACVVNDVLSQVVLELLQAAICHTENTAKGKKKRDEDGGSGGRGGSGRFSNSTALGLSRCLLMEARSPLLVTFLHRFLLRCNVAERRSQAHALVLSLFQNVLPGQQTQLLELLWNELWPEAGNHGAKAAQLVDLIAYFTMQLKSSKELKSITDSMLKSLKEGLQKLAAHPNSNLYSVVGNLLETDGYYLEDNPCLVCNNPEVAMANVKLSSVKLDSRFTTSSQIVKMTGSHEISRITVKLTELKRKMIKQMNVFYSNKSVQSAVDLKNKPELWLLAKKVSLNPNTSEVKMDFPVPIVACNMMIEFASFYDKNKNGSELVHCPRCSASVPANPGVCANCGENVFQCHKCRAINYDEKDPFLCNSCGFSKYAKFEITLTARQVASVEPIHNEEDRNKTLCHINSLLEKADQTHNQLLIFRLQLERVVNKLNVIGPKAAPIALTAGSAGVVGLGVNTEIQQLALMYTRDCKMSFEELSRLIQRVLANRAELLQYDSRLGEQVPQATAQCLVFAQSNGRCYGCMTAQACNCVKLVRALCTDSSVRHTVTANKQLLDELAHAFVTLPTPLAVLMKDLLCELNRDSVEATNYLCQMIKQRVLKAISDTNNISILTSLVEHDLQLLRSLVDIQDALWEVRIKCVYQIFLSSLKHQNRMVMEYVTAPCLTMLHWLSEDSHVSEKGNKGESGPPKMLKVCPVDMPAWIEDNSKFTLATWKHKMEKLNEEHADKKEAREFFLMNKYGQRWLKKCGKGVNTELEMRNDGWLQLALFYPNSVHMRMSAAAIFKRLCTNSPERKAVMLDILASYAEKLSALGERTAEYVALFKALLVEDHWKFYLALRGFLPKLGDLITQEVERLNVHELEGVGTDVSQGYAIKIFAELLQDFLSVNAIRRRWAGQLVGCVLHGYLALRRLVLQRTKMVDDAQSRLLLLLEDLTTGTESDTKEFMGVCIETLNKYLETDLKAPVFIFERLCSIIFPEEKEIGEFFVNIEKDTAQEDFLQGRMMANPYSSNDLGKLMKDVKNRICRDCELIALLEDDTGMELLVNNKIISLELPLAEVYKKLWKPENDGEAMLIVYRMRGLLGDATEEFIETLDSNKDDPVNEEEVYRLAGVMGSNGGLQAFLYRLRCIRNLSLGRPLLSVLLKLFSYCVKLKSNRLILLKPEMNTMPAFVAALKLVVVGDENPQLEMAEQILAIIRCLIEEAQNLPQDAFKNFSKTCGSAGDVVWILGMAVNPQVAANPNVLAQLAHIIPNITLGSHDRMAALVDYFIPSLRFNHPEYELDLLEQRISRSDLDLLCLIVKEIQDMGVNGIHFNFDPGAEWPDLRDYYHT